MPNDEDEILSAPSDAGEQDELSAVRTQIRMRRRLPGRRLDKYLSGRFSTLSRTTIQRLIKSGDVTVNGKPTKPSYEMLGGDLIELTVPQRGPLEIVPENIPLDVLWEDEHLIAINKRAGIICHPAHSTQTGTICNALAYYSANLSQGSDPFRPGIVHRLDKNTTGVMLVAKHDEAHWRLALQFERRVVQKTYLAVVEGGFDLDRDTIDAPIGVHPVVREKFAVMAKNNKIDWSKDAVTHFEVAERFRGYTLVKLFPKTGRTHQLRVHMSYVGRPIVGDAMYGGKVASEASLSGGGSAEPLFVHQALHAWQIEFRHPILEHKMKIEAPFHEALRRLVQLLRRHRALGGPASENHGG